ncbi:SRPBCC family protein [Actinomadura sp. 9N407]|uniref:SRPBCC family protein n=1 Tax=Actinomadura sp. 9N407 TaxID=3375154 RepID=UPI0037A97723
MASIHKEFTIDADPESVWAVVRDYGAVHHSLAPGFAETHITSDTRVVTFADGTIVHERLVDLDEETRRVAYTVVGGSLHASHHHASMQVLAEPGGRTRFIWHTDVLPDALAAPIREFVEHGSAAIRQALESGTPTRTHAAP